MQSKIRALPQHAIETATKCCKICRHKEGPVSTGARCHAGMSGVTWGQAECNGVSRSTKEWEIAETGLPWMMIIIIIIKLLIITTIMEICKAPTLRLKALNKHNTHNVHRGGKC